MSDFTLDYFYAQLQKYIEKNKAKLEATPDGAYAVTDYPDKPDEKGVIFFLRLQNAGDNKQQRTASPIHPYYAVYIRNNGDIRYGSMNAKHVLDLFEAATENKAEAIDDLCLKFDQETEFGEKMDDYNQLLDNCHFTHQTVTYNSTNEEYGTRRFA